MPESTLRPKQYDVSLSYASEDRPYVRQVAALLQARGIRLFYDQFEDVEQWGKDMVEHLDRIYRLDSQVVVVFVSQAYGEKDWTRHERRSMLAAALRSRREYILPVRFDDTELDGFLPTQKFLDARIQPPAVLARKIVAKLKSLGISVPLDDKRRTGGALAWRIASRRIGTDLVASTAMASRVGGRWNPIGSPVLYAGASYCVALLELLAHLPAGSMAANFVAMSIRIPSTFAIETLYESDLPPNWRDRDPQVGRRLAEIGAEWLASQRTCVLSVPSASIPNERQFLMNPAHAAFAELEVLSQEPVAVDGRLLARL